MEKQTNLATEKCKTICTIKSIKIKNIRDNWKKA